MNFKLYGENQGETNSQEELQIAISNIKQSLLNTSDTEKQIEDFAELFSCIFRYANYKKINLVETGVLNYWFLNAKTFISNELKTKEDFILLLESDFKTLGKESIFQMILNTTVFVISLGFSIESITKKSIIKPSVIDEAKPEPKKIAEVKPETKKKIKD